MKWRGDGRDEQTTRRVRKSIVAEVAAAAAPETDLFAVELIAGELLSNVARYTPGPFDAKVEWDDRGRAVLELRDRGDCPPQEPVSSTDPTAESGRGLAIVRALGGRMRVERDDNFGCRMRVALPAHRGQR